MREKIHLIIRRYLKENSSVTAHSFGMFLKQTEVIINAKFDTENSTKAFSKGNPTEKNLELRA